MSKLTDRQSARERIRKAFEAQLDRLIPLDESMELEGTKFIDWEDQGDELDRAVTGTFLQERAALDGHADVDALCGGPCPSCGSRRIYIPKAKRNVERNTPHGPVVLSEQTCRCRACGKCFSPSAKSLGVAGGLFAVDQGSPAGSPRVGGPELPKGG
jgi:hypothetical protein